MTARMLNAMISNTIQTLYQRLVVVFAIPQLHYFATRSVRRRRSTVG
jgi:hypothetical protein